MVTIGLVVGLDYRDASLSVHDLLQELKTHPKIRKILEGGERVQWGAKTIPSGGFNSLPRELHAPGLLLCGDGVGHGQRAAPQGHPLRDRVGTARRRGRVPRAAARRDARERALVLRRRGARQLHLERPVRGAEHAPGLPARLLRRRRARERDDDVEGRASSSGRWRRSRTPTSRCSSPTATRATRRPTASSPSTSSRRSSPRATRRATTSRTTSGSSGACPREVAQLWAHMCPAQVYEVGREDEDGTVLVERRPVELRPVRRDHRQGRPAHAARGRLRARVHADLIYRGFTS